jgi:hypothetical protein
MYGTIAYNGGGFLCKNTQGTRAQNQYYIK